MTILSPSFDRQSIRYSTRSRAFGSEAFALSSRMSMSSEASKTTIQCSSAQVGELGQRVVELLPAAAGHRAQRLHRLAQVAALEHLEPGDAEAEQEPAALRGALPAAGAVDAHRLWNLNLRSSLMACVLAPIGPWHGSPTPVTRKLCAGRHGRPGISGQEHMSSCSHGHQQLMRQRGR